MVCLGVNFFALVSDSLSFLNLYVCACHKIWDIFSHFYDSSFSMNHTLSFWNFSNRNVSPLIIVPWVPKVLFFFFFQFFSSVLFKLDISIDLFKFTEVLSGSLQFLSSVTCILLLSPFSEFFYFCYCIFQF